MKLTYFIFSFLLLFAFACSDAQNKEADSNEVQNNEADGEAKAKEAFQKKYANAEDVEWGEDSNGYYEASFKSDNKEYRADFKKDGSWLETERSIKYDELPQAVKQVIDSKYDKDNIAELEEVEHYRDGKFYDIEFKEKGKNKDVMLKSDGTIIPEQR